GEALFETEGVVAEAQAEEAGALRRPLLDPGEIGLRDPDGGLVLLREREGQRRWLNTGASTTSSTIMARANPPVKHRPTPPPPAPPHRSCAAAASWRSQTVIGLVLFKAKHENSR